MLKAVSTDELAQAIAKLYAVGILTDMEMADLTRRLETAIGKRTRKLAAEKKAKRKTAGNDTLNKGV